MDTEVSSCGRRNRGRLSYSSGGEPEIGKIFDTEGGPVQAQQRVQSYLLGRGVNDTQSWASWTQLGNTWRALSNPYRAVQCFRKAMHLKGSDDPDVLLNLALTLQHSGALSIPLSPHTLPLSSVLLVPLCSCSCSSFACCHAVSARAFNARRQTRL